MPTRDQEYAAQIFQQVQEVASWEAKEKKKYGSMAHKLPVLIRSAGLVQALAFVAARGNSSQQRLLEHVAVVVGEGNAAQLLSRSRTADLAPYMALTQRVIAALLWYKRFAQSVLGVEQDGDEEQPEEAT